MIVRAEVKEYETCVFRDEDEADPRFGLFRHLAGARCSSVLDIP